MAWHGQEDVEPLQDAKERKLAKAQDSLFSNLVIQDHIESIGKPILLKGMRCCLMVYLLKMLSDMLQSPQPLCQFQTCPKPKVKLGPTELIHPVPPSSFDIAIARNPNQFGLTDRDFGLTEMGLQTLCSPS